MAKMSDDSLDSYQLDSEVRIELDIRCLQILRAIIYNQIVLIDEEDKERNPLKYKKYPIMIGYSIKGYRYFGFLGNVSSIYIRLRMKYKILRTLFHGYVL